MTAHELILSGKLELYVAGTLTESEMSKVAIIALESREVASEIEKIERAMVDMLAPAHFELTEREKDTQLLEIFDRITDHCELVQTDTLAIPPPKKKPQGPRIITLVIASLTMLTVGCVVIALNGTTIKGELAALGHDVQNLDGESHRIHADFAGRKEFMGTIRNYFTKRVELKSIDIHSARQADFFLTLYWNPVSRELLLADAHLPDLLFNQQYQLWALHEGKPTFSGLLPQSPHFHNIDLTNSEIDGADSFALTIEPLGGSKTPSYNTLYLRGNL
jgi:hypothetical protein